MKAGEMESYQLPWGYELVLYDQDGLTGNSLVLRGKQDTENSEFEQCINLSDDWRNKARSYEVKKIQDIGEARVRWVYFAATEGIDVQIHYGFQSTNTETTTDEQTETLSYEMTTGYEFEGASAEEKIGLSYSNTITQST